ncbi:MAG: hypothetical protein AAF250_10825 [Pseudomonadota bacterium]
MQIGDLNTRSPFEGFPRTIVDEDPKDGSALKHTTDAAYQGPWLARISDFTKNLLAVTSAGGALYAGVHFDAPTWATISAAIALPIATFTACHFGLPKIIRRSRRVVFTPEHVVVFGLVKVTKFDRSLPHSFSLHDHMKKDREEQQLSVWETKHARKWWGWARKRYLGNCYHIAFQYMGQRHDLMTVYSYEIANKILTRLKANDEAMEAKTGNGRGQALKPEDEWVDQSGELDNPDLFGSAL